MITFNNCSANNRRKRIHAHRTNFVCRLHDQHRHMASDESYSAFSSSNKSRPTFSVWRRRLTHSVSDTSLAAELAASAWGLMVHARKMGKKYFMMTVAIDGEYVRRGCVSGGDCYFMIMTTFVEQRSYRTTMEKTSKNDRYERAVGVVRY